MSLRTAFAVLRRTLGPDALLADRERVQLNPDFTLRVDVWGFQSLHVAAPEQAIQLYAGDLLADFYDDWVVPEREHLRTLQDELAVEPSPETQALYHWIKQTSAASSDAARITNLLIPLTSFIGRKAEAAQVKALLLNSRLLTLTGAGGSGKTRLSIQVAMDLINAFPHGVWWAEFANVTNPALVPQTVAKVLGVGEKPRQSVSEALAAFLRERRLLLLFDNCEHLVAACANLADLLLRECPHLKILATSREPLCTAGEQVWHVPTLSVPGLAPSRQEMLLSYESVRLFVERARAVQPDFSLDEQNVEAVTQICRRLDGIPLAIELAAVRTAVLSVHDIAARLDDRFSLLTSGNRTALPRQQTLKALVDWSYDLLSSEERTLFQRLAVFSGGRSLPDVEGVCAFGELARSQMLDLLSRLIAKSLLNLEPPAPGGETRYGCLDTIKQYARERLEQSGEGEQTRRRHLAYFLERAEAIKPKIVGAEQIESLNWIEREHANLRLALKLAIERGLNAEALRFGIALADFWDVRSFLTEGREWLRQVLAVSHTEFENSTSPEFRAL